MALKGEVARLLASLEEAQTAAGANVAGLTALDAVKSRMEAARVTLQVPDSRGGNCRCPLGQGRCWGDVNKLQEHVRVC